MEKVYTGATIGNDIAAFERDILEALSFTSDFVYEKMVEIAQDKLEEDVYSYEPQQERRRKDGDLIGAGGLPLAENWEQSQSLYNSFEKETDLATDGGKAYAMTVRMTYSAPWQDDASGAGKSLGDAIEDGTYMHGAGARPFLQDTAAEIERNANEILIEGLEQSGFIKAN